MKSWMELAIQLELVRTRSSMAKICSVADVFEALTSHRPYRKPMPNSSALAILERGVGTPLMERSSHVDEPYKEKLDTLLSTIDWSIRLPARLADFFAVRGDSQIAEYEERKHIRLRARAKCIGFFESGLTEFPRGLEGFRFIQPIFQEADVDFWPRYRSFHGESEVAPANVLAAA